MPASSHDPSANTPAGLPKQFGPYRILRALGKGGMGTVYLAHDTRLDRSVALKVCHDAQTHPQTLARFRREAQAAASLRHPNLCPVYETDVRDGIPYLTMAYIEGPTLSDWLGERPALSPREAVLLVRKLALAMQEAHDNHVIHRDLKPANIVIDRKGEPVILDFGLAKSTVGGGNLTKLGAILGTLSYMAPEQVLGDSKSVGPPCDVYALGVILYELLTGRVPFEGAQVVVLGKILHAPPPPPRELRPDLEPPLVALILKALAKKPQERFASMTDFAAALTGYARTAPSKMGTKNPSAAPTASPARPRADASRTKASIPDAPTLPPALPDRPSSRTVPFRESKKKRSLSTLALIALILLAIVVVAVVDIAAVVRLARKRAHPKLTDQKSLEPTNGDPNPPAPFVNSVRMPFVSIQPGSFLMGSDRSELNHVDSETRHKVTLTKGLYMGATLVTQSQWRAVMDDNPSHFRGNENELPVDSVSWEQCQLFCQRLSEREKRVYRLPTEAEWEYCCRAGTTTPFYCGETISPEQANYKGTFVYGKGKPGVYRAQTTPVLALPPNPWGLYDMHGNLFQWCMDYFGPYSEGDNIDPRGPDKGATRILRGGSWSSIPEWCRAAYRIDALPIASDSMSGFRVVLDMN